MVTEQSRGCRFSLGNVVSDGVIPVRGAQRALEVLGTLCKVCDCLTPKLSVHLKPIQSEHCSWKLKIFFKLKPK